MNSWTGRILGNTNGKLGNEAQYLEYVSEHSTPLNF